MSGFRFVAYGLPAPKGSTKSFVVTRRDGSHRTATTAANPRTKDWQTTIAASAMADLALRRRVGTSLPVGITFPTEAIALEVTFFLPRPKALLTKRHASAEHAHTKKPDLDKLLRATKDALTKVVWTDDAQVTEIIARKRYCAAGDAPRADIWIRPVNPAAAIPAAVPAQKRG